MTDADKKAIEEARQAVLNAPDRQSAIEAYRYWYELKFGILKDESTHDDHPPRGGWLSQLEKYYG